MIFLVYSFDRRKGGHFFGQTNVFIKRNTVLHVRMLIYFANKLHKKFLLVTDEMVFAVL